MKQAAYSLDRCGNFIIENYQRAKAFSSFFPGIAGLHGIPLWAFYVNRGQALASFGIENKDGAILEFMPANQAYAMTSVKGFRTFIKIKRGDKVFFYEPFALNEDESSVRIESRMIIRPSSLELEEIHRGLGLKVNVVYYTVPNESFAALARTVSVRNISRDHASCEIMDGLPLISPYGMTEWHQKHMSRTIEAWMQVRNVRAKVPFYALKINPQDRPELELVERGHFCAAFLKGGPKKDLLPIIVDPRRVFGIDGDISFPRAFWEADTKRPHRHQKCEGITPCAFSCASFSLHSGKEKTIHMVIGNVKTEDDAVRVGKRIRTAGYFEKRRRENEEIIHGITDMIYTRSGSTEFDFYTRATYLDNVLRGGFPLTIDTPKGANVYYAFARKHGDLERDYNAFNLQPSYYSQGNGAYRDINQNRRNDVLFNPHVKEKNIRTFMNAIQLDGFNPHRLEGVIFRCGNRQALSRILAGHGVPASKRKGVHSLCRKGFTPGALLFLLEQENIMTGRKAEGLLSGILAVSTEEDVLTPGEGYWVDHWTYNMGLIENYLSCYPERRGHLLAGDATYTFYDTYLQVQPRDEKYVLHRGEVRQYGAVVEDKKKKDFIFSRKKIPHVVRTNKGEPYTTTLTGKLLCILANKMASLDPYGAGVEMEAGKPGWCDSLNGLPGIFGSSMCETYEIKRFIQFMTASLDDIYAGSRKAVRIPQELAGFIRDLISFIERNLSSHSAKSDFTYWQRSSARKEDYRRKVWYGVSGREKGVSRRDMEQLLSVFLAKIERALKKGYDKKSGMTYSYFMHSVSRHTPLREKGRVKTQGEGGLPLVRAGAFTRVPVALFLEGPVHAMRVYDQKQAKRVHTALKASGIYDKKLSMYKVNEPLKGMPVEIGRSMIFTPGWLENESVWLHMEYKYLLELLKKGLYKEYFDDLSHCLVAYQDPARYGRSILENSSFIVSSAYPDTSLHGTGFVARLTGTTTEFVTMWLIMSFGHSPFSVKDEKLMFTPSPVLTGDLFTRTPGEAVCRTRDGRIYHAPLPENTYAAMWGGMTLIVYHNPERKPTFGSRAVTPVRFTLKKKGSPDKRITAAYLNSVLAKKVRSGYFDRIDILLERNGSPDRPT